MSHARTTHKPARSLVSDTASALLDFTLGTLPMLGALAGIVGIFVGPLWYLASSLGLLG